MIAKISVTPSVHICRPPLRTRDKAREDSGSTVGFLLASICGQCIITKSPEEPHDFYARAQALEASVKGTGASTRADLLKDEIERLLLIAEAIWEIIKEKHDLDDAELLRHMEEIDLRDGKLDGRVAPTEPGLCPRCQRKLAKRHPSCIYCGASISDRSPFAR